MTSFAIITALKDYNLLIKYRVSKLVTIEYL